MLIKLFSQFPEAVEKYYSNGVYVAISRVQRFVLGWIPFSVGDLLYGAASVYLVTHLVRFVIRISSRQFNRLYVFKVIRRFITISMLVYIWFNISWGLNYNRVKISQSLELRSTAYTLEELTDIMQLLSSRLNTLYAAATKARPALQKKRTLFTEAIHSYTNLAAEHSKFEYETRSLKPSLYSYLGNYLGFTGYYNPFTGEAQVNTTVPLYIRPFTTCHEIGHQLGYAKEIEANMSAFLSARKSENPAFRYSVYFDLYLYARRYMAQLDSTMLKTIDSSLVPGVRTDIKDLRAFFLSHANPVEVIIDRVYSQYLRANEQPSGRATYNEVILLLISYRKKHGTI